MQPLPSESLGETALRNVKAHPYVVGAGAVLALLAISVLANAKLAKTAERDNPPIGRFVEVDGVRIHYLDRGEGDPLVLLHGSGSMIQDFECSGLVDLATQKYRVLAFDRPGYGYSERPRRKLWNPEEQAKLISHALKQIGVSRALVLGHSWGASVAIALALNHPQLVSGLVLASGYYYPSARADVLALSAPALPVIGNVIRYSISPIISRIIWPLIMRRIFEPASIPDKFARFPKEMALRPSQIQASAAESALLIPNAFATRARYEELSMPVIIIAGEEDQLVNIENQSARLHRELPGSVLHRISRSGHMVHQTATEAVMGAIDEAAQARHEPQPSKPISFPFSKMPKLRPV
jgi:pimeloyl-ACP methyl ester carboxylesterase